MNDIDNTNKSQSNDISTISDILNEKDNSINGGGLQRNKSDKSDKSDNSDTTSNSSSSKKKERRQNPNSKSNGKFKFLINIYLIYIF